MTDKNTDYHSKGQQDAAQGKKYDKPNSILECMISTQKGEARKDKENQAYMDGYNHAWKKRK